MTSFKVPGIASILCNYEVYWSIWDSPHPHWILCHHGFSWKALFIYLAWKHHCLPQTQFNFLLYSIGLALSDFWLKPQLKSTCDEQSLKRPKVIEKKGATCSRQFPKSTSKEILRRTILTYKYESWDICKIISIHPKWGSSQAFLPQKQQTPTWISEYNRETLILHLFLHTFMQLPLARQLLCSTHFARC